MKTAFTAKYINHLLGKKKNNEGFTLIELLVVIIIVGVLAAIALPSFLSQIGKARGSEAKSTLGTINRAQQAYRLERNEFSDDVDDLDARINGKFYAYAVNGDSDAASAAHTATTNEADLKGYSSAVAQAGDNFSQLICETAENVAQGGTAAVPGGTADTDCGQTGGEDDLPVD